MTALVTKHLPLLADAPDGIRRIRQLIVDLAVSGKLSPEGGADDWQQIQLSDIVTSFQNGVSSRGAADGQAVAVLRLADIKCGEISLDDLRTLMLDAETIEKYLLVDGDVLVIRVNGSADLVGRFIVHRESGGALHCDHFIRLRLDRERIEPRFLKLIGDCSSTRASIQGLFVSTAGQKTVNQGHIGSLAVPLPPIAKQHLIVAKVDELMALCDRLEADQADAEAAHAQLVQALLDSLTQATDTADFRAGWQRLSEHFHTLFTTEASIDALKQTVLQLAVMGKLVPQDSADESPSILLERIANEVAIETRSTGSSKARTYAEVKPAERYVDTPSSWIWTRLGSQVLGSGAGWSPSCEARPRVSDEWGVLKVSAVSWGEFRPEENKALPANLEARPEHEVHAGDFLVSRANTADLVARSVVVEAPPPRLMLSDKIVRFRLTTHCNRRYVNLVNTSPFARSYYGVMAGGTSSSMKNVTREQILNLPLPLPPLAEQHRIVAKVDELTALCDQLKAGLAEVRQLHGQLAAALVEQAVA